MSRKGRLGPGIRGVVDPMTPRLTYAVPLSLPRDQPTPLLHVAEAVPPDLSIVARGWLALAIGCLLLAGLLSLSVVVGRLPFLTGLIDDPLFFRRSLVVHVDLALVGWFYALVAALLALRTPRGGGRLGAVLCGVATLGVTGMIAGGLVRGAEPVLANYIPVIDHPFFLGGLGLFGAACLAYCLIMAGARGGRAAAGLPPDAVVGMQAAAVAMALAAATWVSVQAVVPEGLTRHTYFEFSHWGPGHVLQVANVCAMLGVWCWLTRVATGESFLTARAARGWFMLLLAPHLVMPLLSWQGAMTHTYLLGSTALMRWGLFPVVTILLVLAGRHLWRRRASLAGPRARMAGWALLASAGLTVLGFGLGASIRGSTTLVPAHYHASLGGVTAAFMAAAHLLVAKLRPPRGVRRWRQAGRQLLLFGGGQAVFALGFAWAGVFGLGRKIYAAEQQVRSLPEMAGLGVMGAGGLVATVAGVWFLLLVIRPWRRAPTSEPASSSP